VAVYSPHTHTDESKVELRYLNINRELKALQAGKLAADSTGSVRVCVYMYVYVWLSVSVSVSMFVCDCVCVSVSKFT